FMKDLALSEIQQVGGGKEAKGLKGVSTNVNGSTQEAGLKFVRARDKFLEEFDFVTIDDFGFEDLV
ncbi:MAG: hypothetical protein AAFQ90_13710, partial [Pseudomonadota bacterium]